MHVETDTQRMELAPGRAFDWVAQELLFPSDQARHALRQAFLKNASQGHDKGTRELCRAWTDGIRWLSGEQWLQVRKDDSLQSLLFHRLVHVSHRIYRDPQVLHAIRNFPDVTQVVINKDAGSFREDDPCGFGFDTVMAIEQAVLILQRPACEHPACWCSIDPIFSRMRR